MSGGRREGPPLQLPGSLAAEHQGGAGAEAVSCSPWCQLLPAEGQVLSVFLLSL